MRRTNFIVSALSTKHTQLHLFPCRRIHFLEHFFAGGVDFIVFAFAG
jgi:hypothetical protein